MQHMVNDNRTRKNSNLMQISELKLVRPETLKSPVRATALRNLIQKICVCTISVLMQIFHTKFCKFSYHVYGR